VWTARGTHRGSVMNIPPTGRAINVRGVSVLTIENAQVKNAIYIWDVAGLLRNIGLLPEL
jgi:predicted ester cyclase